MLVNLDSASAYSDFGIRYNKSDQKTLKVGVHSFPAWRSALKG